MRVPKTIWLSTFTELARLILLSTAVLVTVIAFASTVRHTAEGKLDPLETLRFMMYAMPPMLQFALPFAAGFGATLAFHRMTQDNEMTAAAASGVSHKTLLTPALIAGILIAVLLSFLSGQIIPRFLRVMEQMITLDATKILVGSIRAGRPVEFAGKVIHARSVHQMAPPEGAVDHLVLTDLSALELDPAGRVKGEIFARHAWLTFYRADAEQPDDPAEGSNGRTVTQIVMKFEGSQMLREGQGTSTADEGGLVQPIASGVRDDPKFLTTRELAELPDHPDRYGDINQVRRGLALRVVEHRWMRTIDATLRRDRRVKLTDADGREYTIAAAGLDWKSDRWELRPPAPGRDIEIERAQPLHNAAGKRSVSPTPPTRFVARTAGLAPDLGRDDVLPELTLTLKMENVSGQARDPGTTAESEAAGVTSERSYTRLVLADGSLRETLRLPSRGLLEDITRRGLDTDPNIGPGAADLRLRISNLGRHVLSKQHERAANIVAGLVMVLTGAVTALRLGGSLPLTVYLWSFFPAIIALLTISAGQQATRNLGLQGLFILWGGVALLAAYAGAAFWIAKRH